MEEDRREDMITITLKAYHAITYKAMRYDMLREYHLRKDDFLSDVERTFLNLWEDKDNE